MKEKKIPTTLRQVTIPTLNDDEASIDFLIQLKKENRHGLCGFFTLFKGTFTDEL